MQELYRLDLGELNAFCKDYVIRLPKSKINKIFTKYSENKKSLTVE